MIVAATTPAPVALPPARYALRSRAVPAAVLGLLVGVFVTAFYSFRMYFLVFHGEERFGKDHHAADHHDDADHHHGLAAGQKPHETPWVVWLPLVLLAIPSVVIGYIAIEPMLFGDYFKDAIFVNHAAHPAMETLAHHFHGAAAMGVHALQTLPFWLAFSGVALSWFFYMKRPDIPAAIHKRFALIYWILENKYGFDAFNEKFFAAGSRGIGRLLWQFGDVKLIDGFIVNGSARLIGRFAGIVRQLQSGLIYHYAFAMIIGVLVLLTLFMKI